MPHCNGQIYNTVYRPNNFGISWLLAWVGTGTLGRISHQIASFRVWKALNRMVWLAICWSDSQITFPTVICHQWWELNGGRVFVFGTSGSYNVSDLSARTPSLSILSKCSRDIWSWRHILRHNKSHYYAKLFLPMFMLVLQWISADTRLCCTVWVKQINIPNLLSENPTWMQVIFYWVLSSEYCTYFHKAISHTQVCVVKKN